MSGPPLSESGIPHADPWVTAAPQDAQPTTTSRRRTRMIALISALVVMSAVVVAAVSVWSPNREGNAPHGPIIADIPDLWRALPPDEGFELTFIEWEYRERSRPLESLTYETPPDLRIFAWDQMTFYVTQDVEEGEPYSPAAAIERDYNYVTLAKRIEADFPESFTTTDGGEGSYFVYYPEGSAIGLAATMFVRWDEVWVEITVDAYSEDQDAFYETITALTNATLAPGVSEVTDQLRREFWGR